MTALELAAFARTVLLLAGESRSGLWGANKVFINHLYAAYCAQGAAPPLSVEMFKVSLVGAQGVGLLHLSRADLVEAMHESDVRESEINYRGATFHFVQIQ